MNTIHKDGDAAKILICHAVSGDSNGDGTTDSNDEREHSVVTDHMMDNTIVFTENKGRSTPPDETSDADTDETTHVHHGGTSGKVMKYSLSAGYHIHNGEDLALDTHPIRIPNLDSHFMESAAKD